MTPVTHSVDLDRPPREAFDYITDPATWTAWQDAVVHARIAGGGPMREGARLAMRRRMGRSERELTTEMTEYEPPHRYAFRGVDGPVRPIGRGTVEPLDGGNRSRFTFSIDFEGRGIGRLLAPLARRQARRELDETHANLQRVLSA